MYTHPDIEPTNSVPRSPQDHEIPVDEPPAYTMGPTITIPDPAPQRTMSRVNTSTMPGLPNIDYRKYSPIGCDQSRDQTTITITDPLFSVSTVDLLAFIQEQASMPPKLVLRIFGENKEFDIRINMMSLIYRNPPNGWNYIKILENGIEGYRGGSKPSKGEILNPDLESWVRQYCTDKSAQKSFLLERKVVNMDAQSLEGQVRTIIASTGYKGTVTVKLPITHSKVIVHPPKTFMGTLSSLWSAKRYEVVRSIWPFARTINSQNGDADVLRQCAVQSETAFLNDWRQVIMAAVFTRRTGWLSVEDR